MKSSSSIWLENARLPHFDALDQNLDIDVCIIGGGITGISALYYLAAEGIPAMLIEAETIGSGATSRSSGILSLSPEVDITKGQGIKRTRRYLDLTKEAVMLLENAVRTESINCDFTWTTEWGVATEPSKIKESREIYHVRKLLGLPSKYLSRGEAKTHFPFPVFGAIVDECVTIHPVRLLVGLAEAAQARGAKISEHTRMMSVKEDSQAVKVTTERGIIQAHHVLMATEAYSPTAGRLPQFLESFYKRIIPTRVFSVATAPLPESVFEKLHWKDRKVLWTEYGIYNDIRLTPDNRIIIGGEEIEFREPPEDPDPHQAHYEHLEKTLRNLFPQLADIPITHAWEGTIAFSVDEFPFIGPASPRIFVSAGYGGHGLAMGHLGGFFFAEHVLHRKTRFLGAFLSPHRTLYEPILPISRFLLRVFLGLPHPLRSVILRITIRLLHLADCIDRIIRH